MSTREATREKLLEAAEKVFAKRGYYEAAVDEIVQRSSTSKGAVYFHFPNKESLFLAVMDDLGERLARKIERSVARVADPHERIEVALTATLVTLTKHRTLAKLLLSKGVDMGSTFTRKRTEIFERFASLLKELIEEVTRHSPGPPLNPEVVAYAWLGAISEVVTKWLETGRPHPVEEALPTLRAVLLYGSGLAMPEPGGITSPAMRGT